MATTGEVVLSDDRNPCFPSPATTTCEDGRLGQRPQRVDPAQSLHLCRPPAPGPGRLWGRVRGHAQTLMTTIAALPSRRFGNDTSNCMAKNRAFPITTIWNAAAPKFRSCCDFVVATMRHPATLPVLFLHEVFLDAGSVCLVTEFLDEELGQWRSNCPAEECTERRVLEICRTILQAIDFMHNQHRVLHRDLKWNNILFRERNNFASLKVIDMGLARVLEDDDEWVEYESSHGERVKDYFCGTPGYLPPVRPSLFHCECYICHDNCCWSCLSCLALHRVRGCLSNAATLFALFCRKCISVIRIVSMLTCSRLVSLCFVCCPGKPPFRAESRIAAAPHRGTPVQCQRQRLGGSIGGLQRFCAQTAHAPGRPNDRRGGSRPPVVSGAGSLHPPSGCVLFGCLQRHGNGKS